VSNQHAKLGSLVRICTGKLDANANDTEGKFPFFTCAVEPLRIASYSYDCECVLVAGNGDLNVKYYSGKFDAYQRTYIIESLNSAVLNVRYLFHFLERYLDKLRHMSIGGVIKYIKLGNLTDAELRLPPLPEQIRIAAILDQADALRVKRREALAQLDSLTQSIFIEMFGDPATNPMGWGIEPFGDICENQDAQRIPVKSSDRDGRQGAFPYYGASGIIDWVDDYIYEGERLLIGEDGANLLARATPVAYIAQGKYWVNNHAHVVAYSGRANLRFLEFFIEQTDLKPYISGSAQPKLNRSNLDRIPVMLPPLEMQHEFANRIALVEKLKTSHRTSLTELDALFVSLQHRAFRGEL